MRFYTTGSFGPKQELTPEGFLLCRDVPIARTGVQLYADGEIPIEPGMDGTITVLRTDDEVFRDATIASFNGKPVVNEHPREGKVSPDLWRKLSVGVVLNPRRGDGRTTDDAFMYADLLITEPQAITDVRTGKREVSAGYDAEYVQLARGRGQQRNIVGNHVALVDRGRCGPTCAIGDEDVANRIQAFRDRISAAVRTKDVKSVFKALDEAREEEILGEVLSGDTAVKDADTTQLPGVHVHVHGKTGDDEEGEGGGDRLSSLEARVDQLEQIVAMLADDGGGETGDRRGRRGRGRDRATAKTGDEADVDFVAVAEGDIREDDAKVTDTEERGETSIGDKKSADGKTAATGDAKRATVGDSSSMREPFQRMLSMAEILMPGIGLTTFDAAAPATTTADAMCSFKRKTLEASKATEKGKAAIEAVTGGDVPRSFFDKTMTCDAVNAVFNAAASLVAAENSGRARQPHYGPSGKANGFSGVALTPAELNKKYAEFYAKHQQ